MLIVAAFGAVVALQGLEIFKIFGTEAMLPSLVVVAILREAAPTFAGIMMAAQAGSSVAAELAVMKVKEEIDATEVMSVDALRFHADGLHLEHGQFSHLAEPRHHPHRD